MGLGLLNPNLNDSSCFLSVVELVSHPEPLKRKFPETVGAPKPSKRPQKGAGKSAGVSLGVELFRIEFKV